MLELRNWIRTPVKARREYRWEPRCPREPRPTMLHRVSASLDMKPRRLEHAIDGRNVNTKEEKEVAKAGKEMARAKEESEL